jgi:hypothetical protein
MVARNPAVYYYMNRIKQIREAGDKMTLAKSSKVLIKHYMIELCSVHRKRKESVQNGKLPN